MMNNQAFLKERLEPHDGQVDIVIDTDTYNEVDDQFAIAYAMLSPDKINVKAIYAAPFLNEKSSSPGNGMELSYLEIKKVLQKVQAIKLPVVLHGSERFLSRQGEFVRSDAAEDLVSRALKYKNKPLYVVAIAALTNIASAIAMCPEIAKNIVVIWLGGHPYNWHTASEFNLRQDLLSSHSLFDSPVPLIHIPCRNVAQNLAVTREQACDLLSSKVPVCPYLFSILIEHMDHYKLESKPIWDMSNIAYLVNPGWISTQVCSRPAINADLSWRLEPGRPICRVADALDCRAIFNDLQKKLRHSPLEHFVPGRIIKPESAILPK
jgi:inosine-uridine nucleoside N-ribohydrolase